jgi:hypothetical protein
MIGFREDIYRWMGVGIMSAQIPSPITTVAFAFALLTSGLAAGVPAKTAFAVDCITAPNSSVPPNNHWHYRTDRTHQRKCWYLRADNEPSEQRAIQVAHQPPSAKQPQSIASGGPYSLASFKEFMAQNGGAKLSDQDVEKLYADFLEWNHRAKN